MFQHLIFAYFIIRIIFFPDQFMIPESGNNMYANSFLIQAVENNKGEQVIYIFY